MTRRVLITLLLGVNLVLLLALVLTAYSPPQAIAQGIARSSEYIMVAATAEVANDAIYLIDLRTRQMHAFRSTFPRLADQPTRVTLMHTRDLARDFR